MRYLVNSFLWVDGTLVMREDLCETLEKTKNVSSLLAAYSKGYLLTAVRGHLLGGIDNERAQSAPRFDLHNHASGSFPSHLTLPYDITGLITIPILRELYVNATLVLT